MIHNFMIELAAKLGVSPDGYTEIDTDDLIVIWLKKEFNIFVFGQEKVGKLDSGRSSYE